MSQQLINIDCLIDLKRKKLLFISNMYCISDTKQSWKSLHHEEKDKLKVLVRRKNRLLGIIKE